MIQLQGNINTKHSDETHRQVQAMWNNINQLEAEIEELLSSTALKGAPIVRVSAKEKTGINELLETLGVVLGVLADLRLKRDGRFR